MSIRLVVPTREHEEKAIDFKNEFIRNGETVINGGERLDHIEEYDIWLASVTNNAKKETVNPDWVLTDTFFALDDNDKIIGIIDLRHELKGFLIDFGNSGYSVRPSERGKGYATKMLCLLIEYAKKSNMTSLQLSVEKSNEPSVKTIVKNGGVYERSFEFKGEQADVYRIML